MRKKLLMVLALCAALILSACGAGSGDAPAKGSVPAADAESASGETESPYEAEEPLETEMEAQNGAFLLDAEETMEGFLVYTEADGEGLWDSGPRYELYLENNERVPNCYFTLDEQYPGKLTYVVGGGAELFTRWDSVYDENGVVLRVLRPDASFFAVFDEMEIFIHDDGEFSTEIAFCSTRDLPNFQFLSIDWEASNENGSFFSAETLYSLDALTPERPLLVQTAFPGDMPSIGVSYTDADGVTQYYAVSESGYDGSLVLSGFTRVEG